MGSFNLSCSLSGLSIAPGDEAVVLLMESSTYGPDHKYGEPSNSLCFYPGQYIFPSEGVTSLVFLPIFGRYDDYGKLDWNTIDNPHLVDVAAIYDISGLINSHYGTDEDDPRTQATKDAFPNGLFAIWIHGQVWRDVIAATDKLAFKFNSFFYSSTVLEALGFTKTGITGLNRYTDLYTRPDWEGHAFACDGDFGHHVMQTPAGWAIIEHTITLPDITKIATKYKLPISLDIGYPWRHIHLKDYVRKAAASDYNRKWIARLDERIADASDDRKEQLIAERKALALETKIWNSNYWGFIAGDHSVYQNFCRLWADKLEAEDPHVIEICSQFQAISLFFYYTGRLMIPTHGGPQCGEPEFTKELGAITKRISIEKIKKYSE